MGEGWSGGASDIVKAESSGEDPRATGDLVFNLPHPQVNKTKQHTQNVHQYLHALTSGTGCPACHFPHCNASNNWFCQPYPTKLKDWSYPPPPLTKERSSRDCGVCTGTAQVSVSLVSLLDSNFKRSRLHCLGVIFDVILVKLWHIKLWWQYLHRDGECVHYPSLPPYPPCSVYMLCLSQIC